MDTAQRFFVILTELGQPVQCSHPLPLAEVRVEWDLWRDAPGDAPSTPVEEEFELDNSDEFHYLDESCDVGFHVLPAGPAT